MRISDWSSDVCSSDLPVFALDAAGEGIVVLDQPFERTKALGPEQRAVGLRYSIGQAVILVRPGDPAAVAAEAVELDTAEIIAGIIESGGEIGFRVTDDPVEIGITGDRLPGCRAAGERGSIGRNEPPVRPSALTEIVKAMEDCHIEIAAVADRHREMSALGDRKSTRL